MIRQPMRLICSVLFVSALAGMSPAQAQDKATTVRPEVGKPVQAAIDLIKAKRGKEALAKAREALAVKDRSAQESLIVDQVVGQAAALAQEPATAARAYESVATSAAAPPGARRQFLSAAAGQYYLAKEYAKAADLADRYLRDGGGEKSVRTLRAQALYLSGNYGAAAKVIAADIDAEEQAGNSPGEDQLQLLANCYLQQRDTAGYGRAMEKLVSYHPKRDYWLNVLHGVRTQPGFAEKLAVDVARLRLATGAMRTADDYVEAAQLVLQDGFPLEAAKIIEQGYAAGLLGQGTEAERHKRLKDMAARNLAEDRKALAQEEAQGAAGKDGKALFNDGYNYVLHGKVEKGLAMMEQGLKQGTGFKRPEHAKLQLAHAYHVAGQGKRAIQVYKGVQGSDGASGIARLWVIHLSRGRAT